VARQWRIAPPGRTPNPKLPAQQARFARHTDLATLARNRHDFLRGQIAEQRRA
jgi:hypothetical protein